MDKYLFISNTHTHTHFTRNKYSITKLIKSILLYVSDIVFFGRTINDMPNRNIQISKLSIFVGFCLLVTPVFMYVAHDSFPLTVLLFVIPI